MGTNLSGVCQEKLMVTDSMISTDTMLVDFVYYETSIKYNHIQWPLALFSCNTYASYTFIEKKKIFSPSFEDKHFKIYNGIITIWFLSPRIFKTTLCLGAPWGALVVDKPQPNATVCLSRRKRGMWHDNRRKIMFCRI